MSAVQDFEKAFADYVGARYAIALANGTVTLEVALRALGVKAGDKVATTPLTMAATSIAILNVGAVPAYCDVDPDTWLMNRPVPDARALLGVSLYGSHWKGTSYDFRDGKRARGERGIVDDAAQTLAPFDYGENEGYPDFKSYSFQSSKILALGEGGMLVTNDEELARRARSISSLGYDMEPTQPRIDKASIKSPKAIRHVRYPSQNARMNEITARLGLEKLGYIRDTHRPLDERRQCAGLYRSAIKGCSWFTPQAPDAWTSERWTHDYWAYAVACDTPQRALDVQAAMGRLGAEVPYGAWRITYKEPAFEYLQVAAGAWHTGVTMCPVAENLQPRILAFQTNSLSSAEHNAQVLRRVIEEMDVKRKDDDTGWNRGSGLYPGIVL